MQILPRFGEGFSRTPPGGLVPGNTLRLRCDVLDDSGNRLAASGASCLLTRPDGMGLTLTPSAMDDADSAWDAGLAEFTGAGRWLVTWNFTGGTAVRIAVEVKAASNPAPALVPAPLVTTQDLAPILTTTGGALTAVRVNNLPAADALDGTETLLAVQGDQAKQASLGAIATLATAPIITRMDLSSGIVPANLNGSGASSMPSADDSTAMQNALDAVSSAGGGEVMIPAGVYRCANPLLARTGSANVTLRMSPNARLVKDFVPGSQSGLITNENLTAAVNAATRPRNWRIIGGDLGSAYTPNSGDFQASAVPAGGSIINLCCDDLHILDVRMRGLGLAGKFIVGGGDRWRVNNLWAGYALGSTGVGGCRYGFGSGARITSSTLYCFDDNWQAVAASTGPTANLDIGDVVYSDLRGGSYGARCCVVGIGDRTQGPYISTAVRTSNVAVYSVVDKSGNPAAHGLTVGKTANVSGVADDAFNGNFVVTSVTTYTFSAANTGADAGSTGGSLVSGLTTAINSVLFEKVIGFGTGRAMNVGNTDSAGTVGLVTLRDSVLWNNDSGYASTLSALCLFSGSDYTISARNGKPGVGRVLLENSTIRGAKARHMDITGDFGTLELRNVSLPIPGQPDTLGAIYAKQAQKVIIGAGSSVEAGPGQPVLTLGSVAFGTIVDRFDIEGARLVRAAEAADGSTVTAVIRAANIGAGGRIGRRTKVDVNSTGLAQLLTVLNATGGAGSVWVDSVEVTGTLNATAVYDGVGVVSFGFDLLPASIAGSGGATGVQNVDVSSISGGVLTWDGKANIIKITGTTPATVTTITPSSTPATSMRLGLYLSQNGSVTFSTGGNLVMPSAMSSVVLKQSEAIDFGWNKALTQADFLSTTSVASLRDAIFASLPTSDPGAGKPWNSGGVVEISQ